jgi:hypothetical protein
MEHRWGRRIAIDLPVRLVLSRGMVVWGRVRNVSMTGAFIQCVQPILVGTLVSIERTSGTGRWPARALEAMVIWARDAGAGLEWCETLDCVPWARASTERPAARAAAPCPVAIDMG